MSEKPKCGYAGKVSNAGSQVVSPLHPQSKTPQTATVTTGKDLRGRAGSK